MDTETIEPLVVRKRRIDGDIDYWWIGRGNGKDFKPYADRFAPTGYAFKSRAKAEQRATEIEEQLRNAVCTHENTDLVVSRRCLHGLMLWWVGRGIGKDFVPYADVYAPTGYGFGSKTKAEKAAAEIEERLRRVATHLQNRSSWFARK